MTDFNDIVEDPPFESLVDEDTLLWLFDNFVIVKTILESGVSGTFTTADSKTVTVTNGLITGIV